MVLIVKDAIDVIDEKAQKESKMLWFLYDDLDEDFPEEGEIRQKALTGLFQLVQACDARGLTKIRFKIFLREDIWNRLIFDNKGQSSIKPPTDRLLRGKSLETGLKEASKERCNAIKEEYPNLMKFFDALKDVRALLTKEELETVWQKSAQEVISSFDDFANFLSEIGLAEWRQKDERYKFADIYVYGFEMVRVGTV